MFIKYNFMAMLAFIVSASIATPVMAEPPSWAPAHGYHKDKQKKKKHKYKNYDDNDRYEGRYDGREDDAHSSAEGEYNSGGGYADLTCNHSGARTGAVVGGVIGGVLGSKVGKGDGKTLATIAGTIIGSYVGESVGAEMDSGDSRCTGESFEVAQDNQSVNWKNPDTNTDYTVTPVSSYNGRSGQICRDYTSEVIINGRRQTSAGTACKDSNGEWQIIN
jgi:surface antigen